MIKWSEERKRKHKLIMRKSINNRKYNEAMEQRYNRIQKEIDNLRNEIKYTRQDIIDTYIFAISIAKTDSQYYTSDEFEQIKKQYQELSYNRGRIRYDYGFTQTLKNKVKARDNNKCQDCGRKPSTKQKNYKYFEVHHKDENYKNNDMSNLILLCKKCHHNRHHNGSELQ